MMKKFVSVLVSLVMVLAMVVPAFAADAAKTDLKDGSYAVDYTISTETGIQKLILPATLLVKDGKAYVQLVFNDTEVDKLYLGDEEILPVAETKSGYRFDTGTYQVFELPVADFGEDVNFVLHTRGNNLVTDNYTVNVADYDADFDAEAQAEAVQQDNLGAKESRFYDWHVGMPFSLWGPFAFIALVAIAIFVVEKLLKDKE